MRVADVMTTDVITIGPDAPLKEAATVMVRSGISGLPVVDENRAVVGIITEADFVTAEADRSWGRQRRRLLASLYGDADTPRARSVSDAMTADPHSIDQNSSVTEAARKMIELGVKRLPVVTPDGFLVGIISRADVMGAFARSDQELRDEVYEEVALGVLHLTDSDLTVEVVDGAVSLSGNVPTRSEARLLEELAVRVEGVVSVDSDLTWSLDDTKQGTGALGTP